MWPLLYADIGRNASLWHAYGLADYQANQWLMPLCITAGLIASGEIGMRRFEEWLRRRANARRVRQGVCLACGYNLTGNISGVCPECGTAIPGRRCTTKPPAEMGGRD